MIGIFLRGLLTVPLFLLVCALAVVYALRTTVLMPEFITGQIAAVQLYDHLYDDVMDAVLRDAGEGEESFAVALLEAGRRPVTTYLTAKFEGFVTDLYRWLEVADAPAPVFDLTDLGRLGQSIEAELTRRDTLTTGVQALLWLTVGRAVPAEPYSLASLWDNNPDRLRDFERVRATMRRLPILTGLLVAATGLNGLLILILGTGWGARLRGLGVALLPAAAVVGVVGAMLSVSLNGQIELLPPIWPPADVTMSAGLAEASLALVGGIIGSIGEQLLRAAIVTFAVAVALIAGSLADLF